MTVLATSASRADAAATVIANAVDVDDPRIVRRPANAVRDDSDLGERLVTCAVPPLPDALVAQALANGRRAAAHEIAAGRIVAALLCLQGRAEACGANASSTGDLPMNDLFSLAGRTALVTGGSRGIGRMIAAGFLAQGARVYISSRKAEACDATAAELAAAGPCFALPADVSTMAGVEGLAAAFAAREDKLDILVNNAGAAWGETFDTFPGEGLGQGRRPEPEDAVLPDPGADPAAARRGQRRAAGQGDQRRLDRRHLGQSAGDLLVRREQGRPDPAHPAHGAAPGAGAASSSARSRPAPSPPR